MTTRPAKTLLAVRGITQRAVARSYGTGTSPTYISDILAGRRKPSKALRSHIASMLELSEATVWPEFNDQEKKEAPADDDGGHKTEAATTSGVST